jgi:hypothetical protein
MSAMSDDARTGTPIAPPSAFSIVLPSSWKVLPLGYPGRRLEVQRLVRQAFGRSDQLARFRHEATAAYDRALADVAAAGGFFAATYARTDRGVTLSASALAFLGRAPVEAMGDVAEALGEMAGSLAGGSEDEEDEEVVEVGRLVELPIGPAVRARTRQAAPLEGSDGRRPKIDLVRYFVPMFDWATMLVMVFSTPTLYASDAFAELFDQLARSARWAP